MILTRRRFAAGLAALPLLAQVPHAQAALPKMVVNKDPACGCCGGWIDYLKADGFAIDVVESAAMDKVKADLGVPVSLQSCHTAKIDGYVIEGHVPAGAIRRLLAEKPRATGLAVPGMPASSPGMDIPGAADAYDVILFGPAGQQRYGRYRGRHAIAN